MHRKKQAWHKRKRYIIHFYTHISLCKWANILGKNKESRTIKITVLAKSLGRVLVANRIFLQARSLSELSDLSACVVHGEEGSVHFAPLMTVAWPRSFRFSHFLARKQYWTSRDNYPDNYFEGYWPSDMRNTEFTKSIICSWDGSSIVEAVNWGLYCSG